jgi:FAD/FMN-containing dehydrogenase
LTDTLEPLINWQTSKLSRYSAGMVHSPDQELLAELEALLGPRGFSTDPVALEPWIVDWRGRYHGRASALVSPSSREEVARIVRLAAQAAAAIVPQGGNTSMVAGATPMNGELLLSTRRLNKIRSLSAEDNVAIVEAGVILSDLHAAAAEAGRRFPLSLGAKGSATVGGLVSTNAGGTQVIRFGPMRALVLGLEAVLPDGSLFEGLSALRKDNRGYDLRQLLTGAEGTLGIVTAAALKLVPAIGSRAVAWVGCDRADQSLTLLHLLEERLGDTVEGFELVPEDAVDLVLRHIPSTRAPLQTRPAWNILIEVVATQHAPDPAEALTAVLLNANKADVISDAIVAQTEAQAEALWKLRETISEAERADGVAAKHDVSVRVADMPEFLESARAKVEARFPETRVIAFGHLGDGNVHFNVRAPAHIDGQAWLENEGAAVTRFVDDLVVGVHGSISAEHGIGQMKLAEFARLTDPVRLATLRAIKKALDPKGLMNPGKLIPPLALDADAP